MYTQIKFIKTAGMLLAGSILCAGAEFRVKPGDGSFEQAAKEWKKGDSIILAPGTYYRNFFAGSKKSAPCGLTIKAEIPGSAIFRGDRKAPDFQEHTKGIWKAHWDVMPEAVFEHDTLTIYRFCATLAGVRQHSGAWTYDAGSKTLYIRTTDSAEPSRHALSIGVTPYSGINFYCTPTSSGVRDVLLDGFITTGFYSRLKTADERIPSSQKKVAWGVVINHPMENVKISNVTAVFNGYGIGFCAGAKNSSIENCRAFANRNPFNRSGGGIGVFDGTDNCVIRGNLAGNNWGHDVWLYAGLIADTTVFAENRVYGAIRTKARKGKTFAVRNCVSMNSISFIDYAQHMSNCVTFGYTPLDKILKKNNLLMRYDKELKPDAIFADPDNFDCRIQGDTPEDIARRSVTFSTERLFYWKADGQDSADGRSVKNAFGSAGRVISELGRPGTEIYVAGPVKGDLDLKGLKDIAVRGRGAFPVRIQGKIILDNCSGVKLERLAPAEFVVKGGKGIAITQSAGKITADKVDGLRLTHNYVPEISLKDCTHSFITANVFGKNNMGTVNGWSDYNAYAGKVPVREKNSFTAKAKLSKNFTFRNAWQFDGRSIDSMPVGPYRRQMRDIKLVLEKPDVKLAAPDMVIAELSANLPFTGTLLWGVPGEDQVHEIKLSTESNTHSAALSGLKPGKKYYIQVKAKTNVPGCFSNAELKWPFSRRKATSEKLEFTTPLQYEAQSQYFVSKDGNDLNEGTKESPFGTIGHAVSQLRPGDTLTIRGGTYEENFSVPVSGTKEKPVVIQGAPGEKVYLQAGAGAPLIGGITVTNQNYVHFKNLYIYGDHAVPEGFAEYAIRVFNCRGLLFQRLLVCGSTHKILAVNCDDIRLEDCGFNGGHEGVTLNNCTDMVIRNCTFAHAGLTQLTIRNESRGNALIENCIFMNALNKKGFAPLIFITDITKLTERNNCFWNRIPFDQKPVIGWNYQGKKKAVQNAREGSREFPYLGRRQLAYPDYQKELNRQDSGTFSANPGLKVYPDYIAKYKSLDDWKKNWRANDKRSFEEIITRRKPELLRDLKYFLPTNPEVISRGCGPRIK